MDLRDYLIPLRRWWWLLLASTLVATVSSVIAVSQQPPIYQARTSLLIGQAISNPNPDSNDLWLSQQLAQTYSEVAQREPVQDATMAALGLDWLPEYTARPLPNSQIIELTVTDTSPERAMVVAQELANQVIRLSPTSGDQQGEQERQSFVSQQLDDLEAQIDTTNDEIEAKQTELGNLVSARQIADTQAQVAALQAKLTTLQSNYASLLANTRQGAINALSVLEPATLPTAPIGPNRPLTVLTAAAIGFVLAAGAAYLLEYLDRSLKSPEDVERQLQLPLIGFISEMAADKHVEEGSVVLQQPRSPTAESFRVLRTNLEFASVDAPLRTILVSSPSAAEGKTTVATNLAAVMAQGNKRVVLVDCDLRRPRVHRQLGLTNNRGLSDVFLGQLDLREVILPWRKRFAVITSGSLPPNPAELLASEKMAQVLEQLEQFADIVIIDSPPFVVSDAQVLAAKVDGVVMVVQPGKTPTDAAQAMVEQLHRAGARVVGVVLNRIPRRGGSYYYYYGKYRYNYDYEPRVAPDTDDEEDVSPAATANGRRLALPFGRAKPASDRPADA